MDLGFISNYFVPVVMAGCLATGYVVKKWIKDVDNKWIPTVLEEKREQEKLDQTKRQIVMEEALCAMLHERIVRFCERLLIIGYVTADDLKELDYLYNPYRALGGNGTAERLYNKVQQLPLRVENGAE